MRIGCVITFPWKKTVILSLSALALLPGEGAASISIASVSREYFTVVAAHIAEEEGDEGVLSSELGEKNWEARQTVGGLESNSVYASDVSANGFSGSINLDVSFRGRDDYLVESFGVLEVAFNVVEPIAMRVNLKWDSNEDAFPETGSSSLLARSNVSRHTAGSSFLLADDLRGEFSHTEELAAGSEHVFTLDTVLNFEGSSEANLIGKTAFSTLEFRVDFMPIPEPSQALLLGVGGFLLFLRRRKQA